MKNFTPLQRFLLVLPFFCAFSLPSEAGRVPDCAPPGEQGLYIKKFTNYAPRAGGINGRCGTSASGKDACKFFLEDHLEGKRAMTMGAVTQKGGTSKLFGGKYRAVALEQKLNKKQIVLYAGDRYAKSSNHQCKMDIVTRKIASTTATKVNQAKGFMAPLGRIETLPPPKREIERDPAAETPVDTNPGRCRTVKRCKVGGQIASGNACAILGWSSRFICFEKERSCNPNPGSCTDAFR
jgi:hypothetical protein